MTLSLRALEWIEARGLDVELCDKLGLDSKSDGAGGDLLVYPCLRDGKIARTKYRRLNPKEGQQRFFSEKGGIACAFNEDVLRRDDLTDKPLLITEGYEDCIAAIQCGFERTISVPDGAPETPVENIEDSKKYEWIDQIASLLTMERVREIILAVDGDSAGAALQHDLSLKLGRSRCKFVQFPKAKFPEQKGRERLKDLNECLEDYGPGGVREVIKRAEWLKVDGIYRMSDLPPLSDPVTYDIGFDAFSEHYKMRLGDFVVVSGIPGFGKTSFINDLVCRVIYKYGIRAAWASFEQLPQRDHRRNLRSWFSEDYEFKLTWQQKRDADAWIDEHHRFIVPNDEADANLNWLLTCMEGAVVQHGCKIICVDPWNELEHDRGGESETDYTNRSIRDLKRFAKKFQVHLIVVAHPTKLQRRDDGLYGIPSLYDIAGSAAWANKPDLGVIVHRTDEETSLIKTVKSRYWDSIGKPGAVAMTYVGQTRRFTEIERNIPDEIPSRKPRRVA